MSRRRYNPRDKFDLPNQNDIQNEEKINDEEIITINNDVQDNNENKPDLKIQEKKFNLDIEKNQIEEKDVEENQRKKVVYNVKRSENGSVILNGKVENITISGQNDDRNFVKGTLAKELLIQIEKEILKTEIEIEIHDQLIKDDPDNRIYHSRRENYSNNLEYLKKKREIIKNLYKL